MSVRRIGTLLLAVLLATVMTGAAHADVPLGSAKYALCPGSTEGGPAYTGDKAAYRCYSAVVDPLGNTVILREGRSDGSGASGFGWLHALYDHNVSDTAIERIVSNAYPISAPRGRVRYIAELRVEGRPIMSIWVEVDRSQSKEAPDREPFGVLTAYCKIPRNANPENKCPDWVNESL
ncbi:hypothetical protein [Pseudonocardia nigra]|uniref:hypothetical protein n=1 Tax=Pseudonocardia nigra TaxID=1921578 RepID=UPI001C5E1EB4|nr:hypothetical protein [Pseudonocardia nigra]